MNEIQFGKNEMTFAPSAVESLADLGEMAEVAKYLSVKIAATAVNFESKWMIEHLKLPHRIVDELMWQLKEEKLLEILGQVGPLAYQYRITALGLELASRLMDLCGYIGPMPVSLTEYIDSVEKQKSHRLSVSLDDVRSVTNDLTLDNDTLEVATLAFSSNRSLFIFGPAGNGKSSLGRMLHQASQSPIWIPHAIAVDGQVIQFLDPQIHHAIENEHCVETDHRWTQVEQPFVTSGGELTIDQLDLVYDRSVNHYAAPPHLKANCGVYFIDDLGRQRIPPADLLNRWIIPLEQNIDYLTLINGKKIEIPFEMMLIVATNLKTSDVADEAFLRRMGYRIYLGTPSEENFKTIFQRQADRQGIEVEPSILSDIIDRYRRENRTWRASEPRDLLIRCQDVCRLRKTANRVDQQVLDVAWHGYFAKELNL